MADTRAGTSAKHASLSMRESLTPRVTKEGSKGLTQDTKPPKPVLVLYAGATPLANWLLLHVTLPPVVALTGVVALRSCLQSVVLADAACTPPEVLSCRYKHRTAQHSTAGVSRGAHMHVNTVNMPHMLSR